MAKRKAIWVAAAGAVLAFTAGCAPTYPQGPQGIVTGRHYSRFPAHKAQYRLTVTTADGRTHTFKVSRHDYRHCFHQSHYPACTHR